MDTLRLLKLELTNIGGFESFSTELGPITIFVGPNASGKTVILDAIASSLGALFAEMECFDRLVLLRADQRRRIVREELGLVSLVRPTPCAITVEVALGDATQRWTVTPRGRRSVQGTPAAAWGRDAERRVGKLEPVVLPVVAHYPTARLFSASVQPDIAEINGRLDAYVASLPASHAHASIATWMRRLTYGAQQAGRPSQHLAALSNAVSSAVPDVSAFEYNINAESVFVRFADGHAQPFGQLSDGYRNLIGLVADLAWRMLVLNPHLGAKALTDVGGIVLIDELDLHLHPAWQRKVLGGLTRAFPGVQFVCTTHSPQVLASARREWVRVLRPTTSVPAGHVEGRDTNSVLVDVFGVGERDPSWQGEIDAVFQQIDTGAFAEARAGLERLTAFWGPNDPEVVRASTMIALLEEP